MMAESLPLLLAASAAFLVLGGLLVWLVARLLRSNREQIVASGPLAGEQELTLRDRGALLLLVEVPRFKANFRQFEFEVVEKATGQATKLSYDFGRAQGAIYGVNTMRVPLGRIMIERPGPFLVRIAGLRSEVDYASSRIMFSRPYLGRMALQIIGIVICAIGMLLSLLLALWQVVPLEHE
jgi:hypothetical protein